VLYCFFAAYVAAEILFNMVPLLRPYPVFLAVAFVLLHSLWTRRARYTMIFFGLTFVAGLLSEIGGTAFGWFFGAYYYIARPPWMVAGLVPIQTPLSWCVFLYVCDALTDLIIPPALTQKERSVRFLFFAAPTINGLEAMGLDMILDPVSAGHSWIWVSPGPFFGIPISNFVGWFLVAFLSTATARAIGSAHDLTSHGSIQIFQSAPVLLYLLFLAKFSTAALFGETLLGQGRHSAPELVLVGVATTVPYVVFAVLSLLSRRESTVMGTLVGREG